MPQQQTFVLVHGSWHGGWCWNPVAALLRKCGHHVFTPTQTGLGERAHLMSTSITLDTFVEDIANVVWFEQLNNIVLVGHSFGGNAISGVADRMPDRVAHLVYLDAMILENGQTAFGLLPKDVVAARMKLAEASGGVSIPPPPPESFGIRDPALQKTVAERLTPHPVGTYTSPLRLANKVGNGRPATYMVCTDPIYGPLSASRDWTAAHGMTVTEIATGHDAMVTAPDLLADMLVRTAA